MLDYRLNIRNGKHIVSKRHRPQAGDGGFLKRGQSPLFSFLKGGGRE